MKNNNYFFMLINQRKISVNVINLEYRYDRKSYITNHFKKFPEFQVNFFKAIEDSPPALGLYRSFYEIVKIANEEGLPYVVICEDDHTFTNVYHPGCINSYLKKAYKYKAEIFLGGISWFNCGVKIEDDFYWVKNFTGTQFLVIFSSLYQRILSTPFQNSQVIDKWLCSLSNKIFVAVPMFSLQVDFGYSDVTANNNRQGFVNQLFERTIDKWEGLQDIYKHIHKNKIDIENIVIDKDYQIATYIIDYKNNLNNLSCIKKQFSKNTEYSINNIYSVKKQNDQRSLWSQFTKIVKDAKKMNCEIILICQSHHRFTKSYSKNVLFDAIFQGAFLGAEIILGGISYTEQIVPVDKNLCWINGFEGAPYIIIFNRFFETILQSEYDSNSSLDQKLSSLAANKYVVHPFISVPGNESFINKNVIDYLNCEEAISIVKENLFLESSI